MKKIFLLSIIGLVGCSHNSRSPQMPSAPGFACATVSVDGISSAIFVGPNNKEGLGFDCDSAYQDWKGK
jgi:hypothetical protein